MSATLAISVLTCFKHIAIFCTIKNIHIRYRASNHISTLVQLRLTIHADYKQHTKSSRKTHGALKIRRTIRTTKKSRWRKNSFAARPPNRPSSRNARPSPNSCRYQARSKSPKGRICPQQSSEPISLEFCPRIYSQQIPREHRRSSCQASCQ